MRHNLEGLLYGIHFNRMFPWVSKLMGMLPASVAMRLVPPGVIDLIEFQTVRMIHGGCQKKRSDKG